MKRSIALLVSAVCLAFVVGAMAQDKAPLALSNSIPLPDLHDGDFDHFVVDLAGNIVEGNLRRSSDLPTHVEVYRQCPTIGGVAHTPSEFATAWGAGPAFDPMFWDYARGLFQGAGACDRFSDR